jgi:hypothetical protein
MAWRWWPPASICWPPSSRYCRAMVCRSHGREHGVATQQPPSIFQRLLWRRVSGFPKPSPQPGGRRSRTTPGAPPAAIAAPAPDPAGPIQPSRPIDPPRIGSQLGRKNAPAGGRSPPSSSLWDGGLQPLNPGERSLATTGRKSWIGKDQDPETGAARHISVPSIRPDLLQLDHQLW